MEAVIKSERAPGIKISEIAIPTIGANEVLVKVKAASICGTDLHIYQWNKWANRRIKQLPLIMGHELCGEISKVGDSVSNVRVGDFISAESHIVCNTCDLCRTSRYHICNQTKIIGVDINGCYAEYIALPAQNIWRNSKDLNIKTAVLMENFGNAVHAADTYEVKDKNVLITGCGAVGCMTAAVCKAAGAKNVFATDLHQYRLDLAKKMGADHTIRANGKDLVSIIKKRTNSKGVDVFIDMSGAETAIVSGFELLKPGGKMIAFGLPSSSINIDLSNMVVFKGISIKGVVGRRLWESWEKASDLIDNKLVDLSSIITHEFSLKDVEKGFEVMTSGKCGKVVFYNE
ncbi:L-threonine 3-dehydrogenase [Patescibacteria group bacterium]|nr:L-threonine 3-dehydrogenase [Patescibacteria group bacterium]